MNNFAEWEKKFKTPDGYDFSNATHAEHLAWQIQDRLVHYANLTSEDVVEIIDNFFNNLPEE